MELKIDQMFIVPEKTSTKNERYNYANADKLSKKKYPHIRTSALHNTILTIYYRENRLFRLDAFFHTLLHILYLMHSTSPLHFHYSSIELQNGSIHHFLVFLDNKDIDALQSYQYELGSYFLQELHQIPDIKTYLSKNAAICIFKCK
jgi:hypothetical protein